MRGSRHLWLLIILPSVLITIFSYPPHALGPLMFVGLVPVFAALELAETWQQAAFRAWLYVFLCNAGICWWIGYSVHEYTKLPWGLSYPFVFVLSIWEQGAWAVIAGLRHVLHRRLKVRPLLWTPCALMVLDACWPKFFPSTMGDVFYGVPVLRQIADVTGVWGLTALLVATNELGAALVLRRWPRRELARHSIATAALVACALTYGVWRQGRVREWMSHPQSTARLALIQPNIGSNLKVTAELGAEDGYMTVVGKLFALSETTLKQRPSLIIWPETAYPTFYHSSTDYEIPRLTEYFDRLVKSLGVPLLTGGYDTGGIDGEETFNASFLITSKKNGLDIQRYHKALLLMPVERLPWLQDFAPVREFLRERGHAAFSAGPGARLFTHGELKLGPLICLEGLYPLFARKLARLGAQLFVNLTNDSWFGPGMEPELHLQLTAFRAVEARRPIVRVTNTGHTAVVDIDGSMKFETELDREDASVVDVPIYSSEVSSPFMAIGSSLLIVLGLGTAGIWLYFWRRQGRRVHKAIKLMI